VQLNDTIFVILIGQAFVNIGYLINLATRVARIEAHLMHLMKAEGVNPNADKSTKRPFF